MCRGAAAEARREQEAAAADAAAAAAAFTAAVPRLIGAASAAREALQDLSVGVPHFPTPVHRSLNNRNQFDRIHQCNRILHTDLAKFLMPSSSDSALTGCFSMFSASPTSPPTVDNLAACSADGVHKK